MVACCLTISITQYLATDVNVKFWKLVVTIFFLNKTDMWIVQVFFWLLLAHLVLKWNNTYSNSRAGGFLLLLRKKGSKEWKERSNVLKKKDCCYHSITFFNANITGNTKYVSCNIHNLSRFKYLHLFIHNMEIK